MPGYQIWPRVWHSAVHWWGYWAKGVEVWGGILVDPGGCPRAWRQWRSREGGHPHPSGCECAKQQCATTVGFMMADPWAFAGNALEKLPQCSVMSYASAGLCWHLIVYPHCKTYSLVRETVGLSINFSAAALSKDGRGGLE